MISPEFLDILRCPMSPSRTRLRLEDSHLVCERCALKFKIKDGFPVLVVEEAELPPRCESLSDLPCQKEGTGGREQGTEEGAGNSGWAILERLDRQQRKE
jgi:uncharacterized protein YbaR (Trm112 family)